MTVVFLLILSLVKRWVKILESFAIAYVLRESYRLYFRFPKCCLHDYIVKEFGLWILERKYFSKRCPVFKGLVFLQPKVECPFSNHLGVRFNEVLAA